MYEMATLSGRWIWDLKIKKLKNNDFWCCGICERKDLCRKNNKHEPAYLIERALDEGLICFQPEESFRILIIWRSFPE